MLGAVTPPARSYAWLFDVLYGGSGVTGPGGEAAVIWAPHGDLPPGYRFAEQFAVMPGGRGRAFMVSLASRRGAASALTSYNALRPAARRAARAALGFALRSGTARPFLRNRVDIGVHQALTETQTRDELISAHIARLLGRPEVVLAFGGGSGPYRKPVLQVFGTDGTPLAYVKVGWNTWSRDAVRREADALSSCAARSAGGRLRSPRLLHHGQWHGLDLLLTAPLPGLVRPAGAELPDAALIREIAELSQVTSGALAESTWWKEIETRVAGLRDPATRSRLEATVARLGRAHGQTVIRSGRWHGDLVPWNLARLGPRLYAWDWESSSASAPVGLDAVHFGFQVAFVAKRLPLVQSVRYAAHLADPALTALGVPAPERLLLSELHLLELAIRHEEARGSTGDADERLHPAVFDVLDPPGARAAAASDAMTGERAA